VVAVSREKENITY